MYKQVPTNTRDPVNLNTLRDDFYRGQEDRYKGMAGEKTVVDKVLLSTNDATFMVIKTLIRHVRCAVPLHQRSLISTRSWVDVRRLYCSQCWGVRMCVASVGACVDSPGRGPLPACIHVQRHKGMHVHASGHVTPTVVTVLSAVSSTASSDRMMTASWHTQVSRRAWSGLLLIGDQAPRCQPCLLTHVSAPTET